MSFLTPRPADLPPEMADWYVSRHALERVHEHHPNTGWRGVLRMLGRATPLQQGEASAVLCRHPDACRDRYYLSHDRRGIYVVAPQAPGNVDSFSVVTYIRLGMGQQGEAMRIWGPTSS